MIVQLPILSQELCEDKIVSREELVDFNIDTSVYSEERWEKHFPDLAQKETLFQYISKVQKNSISDRVKVSCMLKALFCFIESERIITYKQFAQMFVLSAPEYTNKLVDKICKLFQLILDNSVVKN